MKFNQIIAVAVLIFISLQQAGAQETTSGISRGIKGRTDFKVVVAFENANPEKIILRKPVPNDHVIKERKKFNIQKEVPQGIAAFAGKTTIIPAENDGLQLRTQEFPCNTFNALDDDNTSRPPDVNGAAGFDHLMTTLNTQIRIQNKQGTIINTSSLNGFWNGLGGHTDIYDPKITYDPYDKRWIFVCCATRQAPGSALLIAVSETPDPNGGWTTYTIDADPADTLWFDYPSLGFNRNWITVGGNMFNYGVDTVFRRSRVWVIDKSTVYAGNTSITVPFFDRNYFTISPAITYDPNTTTQWLSTVHNSNSSGSGFYRLFSITGTQAAPVFNDGAIVNVGTSWTGSGVNGPQKDTTVGLDLGDHRVLQSTFRNGALWTSSNVFLPATNPTTCAAQVVQINVGNGTATENIRTTAALNGTLMHAYPSVSVNTNNDIFFGYSTFRNTEFVTSTISYRRNNGQGFFFYYYKGGEDRYVKLATGVNRWGDYSATFVDPEDNMTAWTIQQYARPRVAGTSFWGTWWAKICPGSCATDLVFGSPYISIMGKYEATGTITSTAQVVSNSFIKYDAGVRVTLSPGFRVNAGNKFQAYIEGCGGMR